IPSVMEAAMKSAEASNSLSPLTLLKRLLARIHISKGMLKIRISVMELGRFTLLGGSGGRPESNFDYPPPQEGTQWTNQFGRDVACYVSAVTGKHRCVGRDVASNVSTRHDFFGKTYFLAGAALGCLAMIRS